MRILVAMEHPLMAEAVVDILAEHSVRSSIEVGSSFSTAQALAIRDQPELVLMDAWIGGGNPAFTVRRLLECSPRSFIVVMTTDLDSDFAGRMSAAGAGGYVAKEDIGAAAGAILELVGPAG
jgi:DNA-binding NarL/FixJ family response regulator